MNKYELLTIFSASLSDEQKEAVVAKYTKLMEDNGGKVTTVNKWGVKKLAYPIKKQISGFYYVIDFNATSDVQNELGRRLELTPEQIRKDLALFGQFGKKGVGYYVNELKFNVGKILGLDNHWNIAIVGMIIKP